MFKIFTEENRIKKIIFFFAIVSFALLSGCKNNQKSIENLEFSLDNGSTWHLENNEYDFTIINTQCNADILGMVFFYALTYEDFLAKIDEYKEPNHSLYYYPDLFFWESLKDAYNADYFLENIFIFYFKYESNISKNYIHSVTRKEKKIIVNVNRFEGMATALSSWREIITIKKSDVQDIQNIYVSVSTIFPK